jgi:hypothetical protein
MENNMTVSMRTRKIKPWEMDLERSFGEPRLRFNVTERTGEGNEVLATEECSNHYNRRYELYIKNKDFNINISHTSYGMVLREIMDKTDHVSQIVRMLKDFGFDIQIPNLDNCDSRFRDLVDGLPQGAKADWLRLLNEQKHKKEKETA